jgi:hypothetical protein
MTTSKSKKILINRILAIVNGEIPSARHCLCIMWDDEDPASEDNLYLVDNKKVNYEQWKRHIR